MSARTPYRFGPFMLDAAGMLTKNGVPVRLQPQPALVLAMLIDRAGGLVTREELTAAIWTDGTHVDFERGLNFAVSQVRNALGDAADAPRYIETVPKRGYRFVAPTTVAAAAPVDASEPSRAVREGVAPRATTRAGRRRLIGIAAATFAAVALAAAAAALSGDDRTRVAVLPFDNETADSAYERVAADIADETVSRLAAGDRAARLAVIGNAAALRQPRSFRDVRAIGRDVGAEFVVLAQLKRDERGVRLIAHLIRVSDEAHIWAQTFDRGNFSLETQTELAEAIAAAVAARL